MKRREEARLRRRSSTSAPRRRCGSSRRPALLAVLTPVIIGFGINYLALGAFLAAVILTGQLMANFLSNSGGAWDNAKKYIEDGNYGGKGSRRVPGRGHRRHDRRPVQGHRRPGAQPADQGDEPGLAADPARGHQPAGQQRGRVTRSPASRSSCCSIAIVFSKRSTGSLTDPLPVAAERRHRRSPSATNHAARTCALTDRSVRLTQVRVRVRGGRWGAGGAMRSTSACGELGAHAVEEHADLGLPALEVRARRIGGLSASAISSAWNASTFLPSSELAVAAGRARGCAPTASRRAARRDSACRRRVEQVDTGSVRGSPRSCGPRHAQHA